MSSASGAPPWCTPSGAPASRTPSGTRPGRLTVAERERMQLYAYYTDRILRRGSLTDLADLASASHERVDGSGYPRGLDRSALEPAARVLAAADVYDALTSPRPHRAAMTADAGRGRAHPEARAGRLDGEAVEAVRGAVGRAATTRPTAAPAELTPREVEVLRLIAIGHTTAQVADALTISRRPPITTSSTSTPRSALPTARWRRCSRCGTGWSDSSRPETYRRLRVGRAGRRRVFAREDRLAQSRQLPGRAARRVLIRSCSRLGARRRGRGVARRSRRASAHRSVRSSGRRG